MSYVVVRPRSVCPRIYYGASVVATGRWRAFTAAATETTMRMLGGSETRIPHAFAQRCIPWRPTCSGCRTGSRKNTRRCQQRRICRHPGIAVRMIVE